MSLPNSASRVPVMELTGLAIRMTVQHPVLYLVIDFVSAFLSGITGCGMSYDLILF